MRNAPSSPAETHNRFVIQCADQNFLMPLLDPFGSISPENTLHGPSNEERRELFAPLSLLQLYMKVKAFIAKKTGW